VGKQTRPFDERHDRQRERPGNRPVEQQERKASEVDRTRPGTRAISGPGAADFLTAQGGEDRPAFSSDKGMSATRGDSEITDPRKLVPRLGPDTEAHPGERSPDEQRPASATGATGGGGPDAHNASPVRATGVDDPSAERD
jgi:hypothetical protein